LKSKARLLMLVLAFVLAVAAYRSWQAKADREGSADAATNAAKRPAAATSAAIGRSAPRPDPAPGTVADGAAARADMLRRFNTSSSYRALAYEALKKPEAGGYTYGLAAILLCRDRTAEAKSKAEPSDRQRDAAGALARRCDMSQAEHDALFAQFGADRQADFKRDPLLSLSFDVLRAKDDSERARVIAAILDTQDPLAISYLAAAARQEGKGLFFAGHYYPEEYANGPDNLYQYAYHLASCDFGLDCGAQAPMTLLLCIEHGWCAASYREALQAGLGAGQPQLFAQVETLAAELIVEIRRKHVGAFIAGR
jgi:hypothetical protein